MVALDKWGGSKAVECNTGYRCEKQMAEIVENLETTNKKHGFYQMGITEDFEHRSEMNRTIL